MIHFKHSGTVGDILYALPAVIGLCNQFQQKGRLYLQVNAPADYYYTGGDHPLGRILLDEGYVAKLVPLLEQQPYLESAAVWNNERYDVNLDLFRVVGLDLTRGHLPRSYFYLFHTNYDLGRPWLEAPGRIFSDDIVVNRTLRYRNLSISYAFLNKYTNVRFVGLEEEYEDFRKEVPRSEFVPCKDFLEMAHVVGGSRLFIGNQSVGFALAEGLKVLRILEICPFMPNIIPHGAGGWDFYQQHAFEAIVARLMNEGLHPPA